MQKKYRTYSIKWVIVPLVFVLLSGLCNARGYKSLIGKEVSLPVSVPDTAAYVFVHIIRDQKCTKCSIGTLYHWNEVILTLNYKLFFLFIIEANPGDSLEVTNTELVRKPFCSSLFVDDNRDFLIKNKWLRKSRYSSVNDFLLDKSGSIVLVGNPLEDLRILYMLNKLK